MKFKWKFLGLLPLMAIWCPLNLQSRVSADEVSTDDVKFFREEVLPLFKESCHRCHGEKQQKSGLRLDSRDAILKGGQNGPAIVPKKSDESFMMKVLEYSGDIQMPPDAKLDDEKIAIFKKWIEKDAPWPVEKKK